ncbi:MAG: tetratricopeptide repeat protein [Candidatus Omnitrophota bacterium]
MKVSDILVLEILKQDSTLKMSIFEKKELVSTLRHYSQCAVDFREIKKLSQEVILILNSQVEKGVLQDSLIKSLKNTGQLLWDHLLTNSVKSRLKSVQDLDLIFSIDEELINIPWELLYDGNNFLCLKFNLGRVVRTQVQVSPLKYRGLFGALKMLILANPTNDLKSAYLEGLNIRNQFDRKRKEIKIDFKSTSIDTHYVKKYIRDYDLVHFAGHCEYDAENPKNTGWVLSDGRFTTQDILTMGAAVSLPVIIFSNSCHSAFTSGNLIDQDYQEKSYSLASAFLFSGVRHYLGAIRRIEDPLSLFFAREFYSHLVAGKTVGESVRLSRLSSIAQYGIGSIAWASYLLYGDPNFALFKTNIKKHNIESKINTTFLKKFAAKFTLSVLILVILIALKIWLPTINPSTYLLFSRSQKFFLKGANPEAISLTKNIIKKDPYFLASYPLIGDIYARLGNPDQALKYYFNYALASEKKNNSRHLTAAYIGVGWIYHSQGQYPEAKEFYDKGLKLSRENEDKLNEADVLGKIAIWFMDKEEYEKALELLTKSSEINRERQHISKHKYNLACDYFNLGLLFINKDDFPTAKKFYDKSFKIFERLNLNHELSDYYFNTGEVFFYQKEYQKALDYYFMGLKIDQKQGNLPSIAADYNMIGELYLEIDKLEEAEEYFNKALMVCGDIKSPLDKGYAYWNLGTLYTEKGRKHQARDYLREAQEIFRKIETSDYNDIKQDLLSLYSAE